jgi:phosphoserine phosphatase
MTHGYVLDHGKVYGLKAGGGTTARRGFYPEAIELTVTDAADRTWTLSGEALTTFPLAGVAGHGRAQLPAAVERERAGRVRRVHGLHRARRARGGLPPGPHGMSPPPVRAVLFDLDGTLVQTRVASWEIFSRVNDRFGLGVDEQEQYFELFRGNIYASIRELCRDEAHAAEVKAAFLTLLREEYTPPLVPGVADVVRRLAAECTLAVMSSNATQVLRRVLEGAGLAFCFAHVFRRRRDPRQAGGDPGVPRRRGQRVRASVQRRLRRGRARPTTRPVRHRAGDRHRGRRA